MKYKFLNKRYYLYHLYSFKDQSYQTFLTTLKTKKQSSILQLCFSREKNALPAEHLRNKHDLWLKNKFSHLSFQQILSVFHISKDEIRLTVSKFIIKKQYKKMNKELIAQEKGYVKTDIDGSTKRKQTNIVVDPITGDKITTVTKTKIQKNKVGGVRGSRSNSSSSSSSNEGRGMENQGQKSKHTYEKKIVNTEDGPQTIIKQKHRQGGIRENIKNKIQSIIH